MQYVTVDENNPPRIIFEKAMLPRNAFWIDILMNHNAFAVEETSSVWWWRFPICVGVYNEASSDVVLRNVNIARDVMAKHREQLSAEIRRRSLCDGPEAILNDWNESLRMIEEEARKVQRCRWIAAMPQTG